MDNWTIHEGDALDVLRGLPAASVDLIATDPPYFRVKDEDWDRQWDDDEAFLAWLGEVFSEMRRVLTLNGSLYVFASPQMAARVEVRMRETFAVLNNIRWEKAAGWHNKTRKEDLRSFLEPWEAVIFAEQKGAASWTPIGARIAQARQAVGKKANDIDVALGRVMKKDPTKGTALCYRWEEGSSMPTEEDFCRALVACGDERPMESIQDEYKSLLAQFNEQRRFFFVTQQVPHTDRWDFRPVAPYPGKHPCEKPLAMMEHIILSSSKPGHVVLDAFLGSGTTGVAAVKNGRDFIGIEKSQKYAQQARRRLAYGSHRTKQLSLLDMPSASGE